MLTLEEWHNNPFFDGDIEVEVSVPSEKIYIVGDLIKSYSMSTAIKCFLEPSIFRDEMNIIIRTKSVLFLSELWHIITGEPMTIDYKN